MWRDQMLASWLTNDRKLQAATETIQNGSVSRSRSGRPLRSHAQRLST